MPESLQDLAWGDMLGLVIIGTFFLLGLWRGLWWQVVRLVGVVASVAIARAFTPRLAPEIKVRFQDLSEAVIDGGTWCALFVASLLAASLLGMLGKRALEGMQLTLLDRVGGGVAGLLTGANLHAVFMIGMVTIAGGKWSGEQLQDTGSRVLLDTVAEAAPIFLDAKTSDRLIRPAIEELEAGQSSGTGLDLIQNRAKEILSDE